MKLEFNNENNLNLFALNNDANINNFNLFN